MLKLHEHEAHAVCFQLLLFLYLSSIPCSASCIAEVVAEGVLVVGVLLPDDFDTSSLSTLCSNPSRRSWSTWHENDIRQFTFSLYINGFHLHGRMPVQLLRSFRFYAAKPERCRETLSRSCCQARQSPSPRWLTFKTIELVFVRIFSFCEAAYSELRSDTPEYNPHRDENHVIGPLLPPKNNAKYIHNFIVSILILISATLYCKVDVDVPGQWTPAGRCDQLSSLFAQKSLRTIWANDKDLFSRL